MLRKIRQLRKFKYCMIPPKWGFQRSQIYRDIKWKGGCQKLGVRGWDFLLGGLRVLVLQDDKVLEMGCKTIWRYLTPLTCVPCNHSTVQPSPPSISRAFHYPKLNPVPTEFYLCILASYQVLANTTLLPLFMYLTILGIPCQCDHIVFVLLCLASST